MPYRQARELLTCDPQTLQGDIEEFCAAEAPSQEKLEFCVQFGAIAQAREVLAQLKTKPPPPRPKRGAGARIRQEQTNLKYLGALKLLGSMTVAEASAHTAKTLGGEPLFSNESEWSRAKARAQRTLESYRAEAILLHKALTEKRVLRSFRYHEGDLQIDWA